MKRMNKESNFNINPEYPICSLGKKRKLKEDSKNIAFIENKTRANYNESKVNQK